MRPRFVEIRGDRLEPILHRGDFVLAGSVIGWDGDGLYVMRDAYGEEVVHDCSVVGGRIRLGNHKIVAGRKIYGDDDVTRAEFERIVTGKVIVTCQVRDPSLFNRLALAA